MHILTNALIGLFRHVPRIGSWIALVLVLQSCAAPIERVAARPSGQSSVERVDPGSAGVVEPGLTSPGAARVPAAAERLQAQAAVAYENGDFARALALLERAQRIAPHDGSIYLDMSAAHRAEGREALACQFVRKGLSVPSSSEVVGALEEQLSAC